MGSGDGRVAAREKTSQTLTRFLVFVVVRQHRRSRLRGRSTHDSTTPTATVVTRTRLSAGHARTSSSLHHKVGVSTSSITRTTITTGTSTTTIRTPSSNGLNTRSAPTNKGVRTSLLFLPATLPHNDSSPNSSRGLTRGQLCWFSCTSVRTSPKASGTS